MGSWKRRVVGTVVWLFGIRFLYVLEMMEFESRKKMSLRVISLRRLNQTTECYGSFIKRALCYALLFIGGPLKRPSFVPAS